MIKTFAIIIGAAIITASPVKLGSVGRSKVYKIYDETTGVMCYVIPGDSCFGECTYSPAISCVNIKLQAERNAR